MLSWEREGEREREEEKEIMGETDKNRTQDQSSSIPLELAPLPSLHTNLVKTLLLYFSLVEVNKQIRFVGYYKLVIGNYT